MKSMKSMVVGTALAAAMGIAPVWAADENTEVNGLSSDSTAVQGRTELTPLSTDQLDSVKGGAGGCNGVLSCVLNLNCTLNLGGLVGGQSGSCNNG